MKNNAFTLLAPATGSAAQNSRSERLPDFRPRSPNRSILFMARIFKQDKIKKKIIYFRLLSFIFNFDRLHEKINFTFFSHRLKWRSALRSVTRVSPASTGSAVCFSWQEHFSEIKWFIKYIPLIPMIKFIFKFWYIPWEIYLSQFCSPAPRTKTRTAEREALR